METQKSWKYFFHDRIFLEAIVDPRSQSKSKYYLSALRNVTYTVLKYASAWKNKKPIKKMKKKTRNSRIGSSVRINIIYKAIQIIHLDNLKKWRTTLEKKTIIAEHQKVWTVRDKMIRSFYSEKFCCKPVYGRKDTKIINFSENSSHAYINILYFFFFTVVIAMH